MPQIAQVKRLTQFALHDELGWSYPEIWKGKNNVSGHPSVFARFHAYIKNSSGLKTPEAFGAATWAEVVPISTANLTNADGKHLEGLQKRLYWSMRFAAWDVTTFYSQATAALVKANDGTPFSICEYTLAPWPGWPLLPAPTTDPIVSNAHTVACC